MLRQRQILDEAMRIVGEVFTKHFASKETTKSLDDLTLHGYIQLLLHKRVWPQFYSVFQLKAEAVRNLLDGVRETRNDLAHFHGEISPNQRDQLHFCADWLERQRQAVLIAFQPSAEGSELQEVEVSSPISESTLESSLEEIVPVEEPLRADDSRYAPLAIWLQHQSHRQEKLTLTFNQIEEILGEELPASAQQHRSWWTNDSVGHVQSRQWLDVGWRVATISIVEGKVTFAPIKEREKAYIDFFSGLLQELRQVALFHVREAGPDGLSWMIIAQVPVTDVQGGFLGFSFTRHGRFRVELYIDSNEKDRNKRLFDMLYLHKDEIQAELKGITGSLERERMDGKRASRIALYHEGAITDPPEKLANCLHGLLTQRLDFSK